MNIAQTNRLVLVFAMACGVPPQSANHADTTTLASNSRDAPSMDVLSVSDVKWQQLNPARGDASPGAANLWGDRTQSGATGFLVRFTDGFKSPPHIHNVSYRGVVIRGLIHNDDPNAEEMWMAPGSYWTQPKGEAHITAARGEEVMAFIEIDEGPYLVQGAEDAYDSDEKPLNVHTSNLIWHSIKTHPEEAKAHLAFLWGDPDEGPGGALLRLESGTPVVTSSPTVFHAVVVEGALIVDGALLKPGSHLSGHRLKLSCQAQKHCLVYVRLGDSFKVNVLPSASP